MRLQIKTEPYNERRYGKPYVGVLNTVDGRVARWGTWIGTPGGAGVIEIDAEPGAAIVHGQKDNRGNGGTLRYGVVVADGTIEYMGKADAVLSARGGGVPVASAQPGLAQILAALGVATPAEALIKIEKLKGLEDAKR